MPRWATPAWLTRGREPAFGAIRSHGRCGLVSARGTPHGAWRSSARIGLLGRCQCPFPPAIEGRQGIALPKKMGVTLPQRRQVVPHLAAGRGWLRAQGTRVTTAPPAGGRQTRGLSGRAQQGPSHRFAAVQGLSGDCAMIGGIAITQANALYDRYPPLGGRAVCASVGTPLRPGAVGFQRDLDGIGVVCTAWYILAQSGWQVGIEPVTAPSGRGWNGVVVPQSLDLPRCVPRRPRPRGLPCDGRRAATAVCIGVCNACARAWGSASMPSGGCAGLRHSGAIARAKGSSTRRGCAHRSTRWCRQDAPGPQLRYWRPAKARWFVPLSASASPARPSSAGPPTWSLASSTVTCRPACSSAQVAERLVTPAPTTTDLRAWASPSGPWQRCRQDSGTQNQAPAAWWEGSCRHNLRTPLPLYAVLWRWFLPSLLVPGTQAGRGRYHPPAEHEMLRRRGGPGSRICAAPTRRQPRLVIDSGRASGCSRARSVHAGAVCGAGHWCHEFLDDPRIDLVFHRLSWALTGKAPGQLEFGPRIFRGSAQGGWAAGTPCCAVTMPIPCIVQLWSCAAGGGWMHISRSADVGVDMPCRGLPMTRAWPGAAARLGPPHGCAGGQLR